MIVYIDENKNTKQNKVKSANRLFFHYVIQDEISEQIKQNTYINIFTLDIPRNLYSDSDSDTRYFIFEFIYFCFLFFFVRSQRAVHTFKINSRVCIVKISVLHHEHVYFVYCIT